jgi:hypothetical protein
MDEEEKEVDGSPQEPEDTVEEERTTEPPKEPRDKKLERLVYKALGEIESLKKSQPKEEVVLQKKSDNDDAWKEKVNLLISRPDLREHLAILEGFSRSQGKTLSEVAELDEVKEIISFREDKRRKAEATPDSSSPVPSFSQRDIAKMSTEEFKTYEQEEMRKDKSFSSV